jgi:hypothetical protein
MEKEGCSVTGDRHNIDGCQVKVVTLLGNIKSGENGCQVKVVSPLLFQAAFDLASYQIRTCSGEESPSHQIRAFSAQVRNPHRSCPAVSFLRPCHASRHTGLNRSTALAPYKRGTGGGTFLSCLGVEPRPPLAAHLLLADSLRILFLLKAYSPRLRRSFGGL